MRLQRTVLKLNKWPLGLAMNRLLYLAALKASVALLKQKGVAAIYVQGSMGRGNFIPGASDIDLAVVTEQMSEEQYDRFLKKYTRRQTMLRRCIPVLSVFLHSIDDLIVAERAGWIYLLDAQENWVLLAGRDVLRHPQTPEHQLVLGWAKLILRRYLFYQKLYFLASQRKNKTGHIKVNDSLLLHAGKLLKLLGLDSNHPAYSRLTELRDRYNQEIAAGFNKETFYSEIIPAWYVLLGALFEKIGSKALGDKPWNGYRPLTTPLPPETKALVRSRLDPFFRMLHDNLQGRKAAIVLSSVPNKNYNYKIYVVVEDRVGPHEHNEVMRTIHRTLEAARSAFPEDYFTSFRAPLVVSETLFKNIGFSEKTALEPYYMASHGEIVFNDLGHALAPMDSSICVASFLADCMTHIRYARLRREVTPTTFIDYVTGTLPAARLLLEKKIITTTPAEAVKAYKEHIGGEYAAFLESFCPLNAGVSPDNVDKGALTRIYRDNFDLLRREAGRITNLYKKTLEMPLS